MSVLPDLCVRTTCVPGSLGGQKSEVEEGVRSPENRIRDSSEPPCRFWDSPDLGPL